VQDHGGKERVCRKKEEPPSIGPQHKKLGDVGSISCKSIPEIGGCNSDQQNFRVFPDENYLGKKPVPAIPTRQHDLEGYDHLLQGGWYHRAAAHA